MRRGPKGKPPELKVVAETDQPCRRRERLVKVIEGGPTKPSLLKGRAAKLWAEKVEAHLARGQQVKGCESSLAQFCALAARCYGARPRGRSTSRYAGTVATACRAASIRKEAAQAVPAQTVTG